MIKKICTLLVLLSAVNSFGQNIILLRNTNPKAKELKHNLNSAKDSLILGSDTKILQVDIFNEDYEKTVLIDDFKTQIFLEDIPEGKFVVEAKLVDKIIIMGLMRNDYSNKTANSSTSLHNEDIAEGKGMMLDDELNVIKSAPHKSIEFLLTRGKTTNHTSKSQKFFWTETQVNNESGSSRTMKLADQKSVDKMILRHQLELNSSSGKLNKLTVWEVYNTGKFMENQVSNPDFVYSSSTDLFNTTPYYSTNGNNQNL